MDIFGVRNNGHEKIEAWEANEKEGKNENAEENCNSSNGHKRMLAMMLTWIMLKAFSVSAMVLNAKLFQELAASTLKMSNIRNSRERILLC